MSNTCSPSGDEVNDVPGIDEESSSESPVSSSPDNSNYHHFMDPITGDIITAEDESTTSVGNTRECTYGRGYFIEQFKQYISALKLKEQLRMHRPYGLGNEMIEWYFPNYEEVEDAPEDDPIASNEEKEEADAGSESKSTRNVLITSLLNKTE